MGKDLRRCLEVIHNDIVDIWNFPQLTMVRRHELSLIFESQFFFFSYVAIISEEKYRSWWMASRTKALPQIAICNCLCASVSILRSLTLCQSRIQNTTNMAGAAGAITAIAVGSANPVGFIVGPIIAGAVFAKWVYDIYKAT